MGRCEAVSEGTGGYQTIIIYMRGAQFSWLERLPVTQEAAGSSPVAPANYPLTLPFQGREERQKTVAPVIPVFVIRNCRYSTHGISHARIC